MGNTALFVFFYIFLYIALIGGFNWGLIGTFNFNLVQFISNGKKNIERGLYVLVGFSSIIVFILSIVVLSSNSEQFRNDEIIEEYSTPKGCEWCE